MTRSNTIDNKLGAVAGVAKEYLTCSAKMSGSNKLEKLSSGNEMCNKALTSTLMLADRTSSTAEAVINSVVNRQHEALKTGKSNIE
ncbi:unnamed protein product [Brugia timori]|uniref:BLOC-1-related complex subunit 7 n=1 Tax=Brugia timori TaxID=42155 RepID=A0A0R3QMN7_9BILA|nr:unnamed protein product [Brugia timori]